MAISSKRRTFEEQRIEEGATRGDMGPPTGAQDTSSDAAVRDLVAHESPETACDAIEDAIKKAAEVVEKTEKDPATKQGEKQLADKILTDVNGVRRDLAGPSAQQDVTYTNTPSAPPAA